MEKERLIQEIVARIRDAVHPDLIVLFGSRARGDADEGSDYDILIIAPSLLPRWRRTPPVYRVLAGLGVAKDVVWWTPEEVAEWRGVRSHFINRALREGRVLYEKSA
jgi:predicted nucleotidyltransferase